MNEIEELGRIDLKGLPPLKPMLLDDLYQKVLKNLHLELGSGPQLYLISPLHTVLMPAPTETVKDFVARSEDLLDYLREAVIRNLAGYSALLDMSSFFIEQNSHLVLARFRERDSEGRRFEIQFYTHDPKDLVSHYEDKIYIGRDFLDLYTPRRKYLGVKDFILSLMEQFERLEERARARLRNVLDYKSYFQEMKESVHELQREGLLILQALPPHPEFDKLSGQDLIEINAQYRTINHYLIELHDEVDEFESLLRFRRNTEFVRYVTKYKKDLTNLISFFNIKINGALTHRIYHYKSNRHG